METLTDTLLVRVDRLIEARTDHWPLLSTTTTSEAIGELAARVDGLENAVREIALEVQRLAASQDG
jgi:predicted sugar kinase